MPLPNIFNVEIFEKKNKYMILVYNLIKRIEQNYEAL